MKIVQESSYTSPRFTENTPLLDSPPEDSAGINIDDDGKLEDEELEPAVGREVRILYLLAVLTGMMLTTTTPMLLSYFIYIGYATPKNVAFFVLISAIETAIPVAGHAAMGTLTARLGVRRTISLTATLSLGAFCILAYARKNRCIFAGAYVVHTLARSIRIARTVRMAEIVPPNFRTANMSIHMFSSLLGCSLGPMLWIFCSQFEGDFQIFSSLYLNRFTLNYSSGGVLCILVAIVSWYCLADSVTSSTPQLGTGSPTSDEIPPEDNADEAPLLILSSFNSSMAEDDRSNGVNDDINNIGDDSDLVLSISLSDGSVHRVDAKRY